MCMHLEKIINQSNAFLITVVRCSVWLWINCCYCCWKQTLGNLLVCMEHESLTACTFCLFCVVPLEYVCGTKQTASSYVDSLRNGGREVWELFWKNTDPWNNHANRYLVLTCILNMFKYIALFIFPVMRALVYVLFSSLHK